MARLNKLALFQSVGYQPHPAQQAVHESIASRRILAAGTRFGKSVLCTHEVLGAVLAPGPISRGWVVTPSAATTSLIVEPLFALLREHFAHRVVEIDERERRAVVRNLSGGLSTVEGRTADRPASLLGATLNWVVVDEAARLHEEVWTTLTQRLIAHNGWALVASVPGGAGSWFHREYLRGARGEEGYASWRGPTWANPAVSPEVVAVERGRLVPRVFAAEYAAAFVGEQGLECGECGWGTGTQRSFMSAREWREARRCSECGRLLTAKGEPVGFEREDGTLGLQVIMGPEDDQVDASLHNARRQAAS
jgi:hypothetical protein